MVQTSEELAAVFRRIISAFVNRDTATIRSLIANTDETLIVGSDAREWLHGVEALEVFTAQVREAPKFEWTVHRLSAFEEGTVGWAAADTTAEFENGISAHMRITAVFHLDDGVWRVMHWHASVPEPSEQTVGVKLTSSLAELVASLDQDVESLLRARFKTSTVTLLFSDIEESTRRTTELGDLAWGNLVHSHFEHLARIAGNEGGIVVKTMGDGAMLAFESARDAVQTAVEIQRSVAMLDPPGALCLRVGVHTGDALYAEGDYFGQTVNKTARIAAAAQGGQVLVSAVVHGLVGESPDIGFGSPVTVELAGLPGTHTIYPLRWQADRAGGEL